MNHKRSYATGVLMGCLQLFLAMLKIGAFTFGGGYAMIHLLDHEFVAKRGWMDSEEFMDLVVIAESTPGPIAINCATYIGYRRCGILGTTFATLGMCLPSFTVIYLISLFFDRFLGIEQVGAAFAGIRVCVVFLILSAGLKMLKKMKKTPFSIVTLTLTIACSVVLALLSVSFSSIFYILIFGGVGLLLYSVGCVKGRGGERG